MRLLLLILLAGALLAQDAPAPPKAPVAPEQTMKRLTPQEIGDFDKLRLQWENLVLRACGERLIQPSECDVRPDQGIVMRRIVPPVQLPEAAKPKPEPKKEGK